MIPISPSNEPQQKKGKGISFAYPLFLLLGLLFLAALVVVVFAFLVIPGTIVILYYMKKNDGKLPWQKTNVNPKRAVKIFQRLDLSKL